MDKQDLKVVENDQNLTNWISFHEQTQQIYELYLKKQYQEGLIRSLRLIERFPQVPSRTHFIAACFHSLLGEKEKALRVLEEGIAKGGWWTTEYLRAEADLKPLHDDSRFIQLGKQGDQKLAELRKRSVPELRLQYPKTLKKGASYDVLLALHWRGGNNDEQHAVRVMMSCWHYIGAVGTMMNNMPFGEHCKIIERISS